MGIIASAGQEFKQIEPGVYIATCYKLIDIGTQIGEYQGKKTARHQVIIGFEFPDEKIEGGEYDGQPFSLSKFYSLSLSEKANLRKDLISWRGKPFTEQELARFDLTAIVGKPCQIQVIHNDKDKAIINSIMAMPKKMDAPKQINPTLIFDLDNYLSGDTSVYDKLGEGMKGIIDKSVEVQQKLKTEGEIHSPEEIHEEPIDNSDIPF